MYQWTSLSRRTWTHDLDLFAVQPSPSRLRVSSLAGIHSVCSLKVLHTQWTGHWTISTVAVLCRLFGVGVKVWNLRSGCHEICPWKPVLCEIPWISVCASISWDVRDSFTLGTHVARLSNERYRNTLCSTCRFGTIRMNDSNNMIRNINL